MFLLLVELFCRKFYCKGIDIIRKPICKKMRKICKYGFDKNNEKFIEFQKKTLKVELNNHLRLQKSQKY